jgi:hypothetical protein
MTVTRGTSNGSVRGSSYDRQRRRAWLMVTYASNIPGFVRCYRCGGLLYNPDGGEPDWAQSIIHEPVPLTIDRIVPGIQGGTYRRSNIRPACQPCNSETGATVRRKRRA